MPQITFLTNIPNPYNGHLYRSLRDLGVDVQVVYKGEPASEHRPWVIEVEPPDRVATSLRDESRELTVRRRTGEAMILGGSWATPRDVGRRAVTAATQRRARILTWGERMSDAGGARGLARRAYFSAPGLDGVLAIGSWAVASYRAATGGRVPIHVFPYTTDDGLEAETRPARTPVVGFSGRLIPEKGPDVLIRALASLPATERPHLEVAGSGERGPELASLASRHGVDVTFHGEVSSARLSAIRRSWWLSITPSQPVRGWLDGWGLVVPESLNSAVPVLASGYVGAAHDLIRDGVNGAVVPAEVATDPEAWTEAIGSLLSADIAAMGAKAREVGRAFSAAPAARWLEALLATDGREERSFVEDTWKRLDRGTDV